MTDIVERLRSPEVFIDTGGMNSPVARLAADEIERLRAERSRLREALKKIARADFNCTTSQMGMAMQGCAEDALKEIGHE
jgi:hypothetical protein